MNRLSLLASLLFALSACAAARVGEIGPDAFDAGAQTVLLSSSRSSAEVARCFDERALLLPTSQVRFEPDLKRHVYVLRAHDLWLEHATFTDLAAGGSEVRFRFAANYDLRWRQMMERDRLDPLRRCAAG